VNYAEKKKFRIGRESSESVFKNPRKYSMGVWEFDEVVTFID